LFKFAGGQGEAMLGVKGTLGEEQSDFGQRGFG
jgi:hypothetical protein